MCLAALHFPWDTATGHNKAIKSVYHLTEDGSFEKVMSTNMFTVGFGGLRLGNLFVCTAQNYVLSFIVTSEMKGQKEGCISRGKENIIILE